MTNNMFFHDNDHCASKKHLEVYLRLNKSSNILITCHRVKNFLTLFDKHVSI